MDEPGKHCSLRGPAAQADISCLIIQGGPSLRDLETREHSGPKGYLLHDPAFWKRLKIWWTPFSRFALSFSWFLLRSCFWTSTTIFFLISAIKKIYIGTSLVVQWLRLCTSTAGGAGLIPGQGTVIPSAVHCGQKKKSPPFFSFSACTQTSELESSLQRWLHISHMAWKVATMDRVSGPHTCLCLRPCSVRLHSWLQTLQWASSYKVNPREIYILLKEEWKADAEHSEWCFWFWRKIQHSRGIEGHGGQRCVCACAFKGRRQNPSQLEVFLKES